MNKRKYPLRYNRVSQDKLLAGRNGLKIMGDSSMRKTNGILLEKNATSYRIMDLCFDTAKFNRRKPTNIAELKSGQQKHNAGNFNRKP